MDQKRAIMMIRLHQFLRLTEAEGPGRRAALWVQGCPIHCPGCFNRQTWNPKAGYSRTVRSLFSEITAQSDLEGVTFTGGEPFAQAAPLAELGRLCRQAGLSVLTYTGHKFACVRKSKRRAWNALLNITDLLLAGPFVREMADSSRPWVGSSNQEFVFLTGKYGHLARRLKGRSELEVWVGQDSIGLNGTAPESEVASIRRDLASLGLCLKKKRRT